MMMIAARKLPVAVCPASNCKQVARRAVAARAAAPESADPPKANSEKSPYISPATGNPQTGKLIDVYFEVASLAAVVVLSVLFQTGNADDFRQPAAKTEWLAMDNKNVRFRWTDLSMHFECITLRSLATCIGYSNPHHVAERTFQCQVVEEMSR
jgi:hypothetical protein